MSDPCLVLEPGSRCADDRVGIGSRRPLPEKATALLRLEGPNVVEDSSRLSALRFTLLGFFQEYRASAAVEELKRSLALTCRVVRDGVERVVPVSTIVPGDIIQLSAGNLIPAESISS